MNNSFVSRPQMHVQFTTSVEGLLANVAFNRLAMTRFCFVDLQSTVVMESCVASATLERRQLAIMFFAKALKMPRRLFEVTSKDRLYHR